MVRVCSAASASGFEEEYYVLRSAEMLCSTEKYMKQLECVGLNKHIKRNSFFCESQYSVDFIFLALFNELPTEPACPPGYWEWEGNT